MAKKVDFYYVKDPTERELNSSSSNQFQTSNATAATRIATKTASLGKETYAALAPTEEELVVAAPPGRSLYKSESGDYLFARMYNTSAGTSYYYRTNLNASVPEGTTDLYCFYVPNATCKVRYYATKVSSVAEGASPEIIDPYLLDACDMASGDVLEFIDPATYTPKGYGLFEGSDEQTPANRKYWGIRQDSPGGTGSRIEYAAPTTVPNDDLNLYCAFVADDNTKPVSFGTLKSMFGTYKTNSDAALDERLKDLPSGGGGGVDMSAVNAAIGDAVGAAKAELRSEMPKPFDFVDNNDADGYLRMKNISPVAILDADGTSGTDLLQVCLWRRNTTSNPQGILTLRKSDIDGLIDAKLADLRRAVEGVVLYEFAEGDSTDGVILKDVDVASYARFDVEILCHTATGLTGSQSVQTVSVNASEIAALPKSGTFLMKPVVQSLTRQAVAEKYLLMNMRFRCYNFDKMTGLYIVSDYGEGGLVLSSDGTRLLDDATERNSDGTACSVRRVVGYPKLPEVS